MKGIKYSDNTTFSQSYHVLVGYTESSVASISSILNTKNTLAT